MSVRARRCAGAALVSLLALAGIARADAIHLYSYDPADTATREAAGGLTFTFRKGLLKTTVLNVRATEAPATALLRPAEEKALGHGGIDRLAGRETAARDLYEVETAQEGTALISAFCPGSKRAWMAFSRLRMNRDLTVLVIGEADRGGATKLCRTLQFNFRGEWALPPNRVIDPRDVRTPTRGPWS